MGVLRFYDSSARKRQINDHMADSVTLKDVAQLAGVSIGTASNAFTHKSNIAPETRTRVLEAAQTLGYAPKNRVTEADGSAEITAVNAAATVTMLVQRDVRGLLANRFYAHVLAGVERECERLNLSLIFAGVQVDERKQPRDLDSVLAGRRGDGLLLVGMSLKEEDVPDWLRSLPIVLIDGYAPRRAFDSVITDNFTGAYEAVRYLIDQGHRHIGLLGSTGERDDNFPSIAERRAGYLHALSDAGIEDAYIMPTALDRWSSQEALPRLLAEHPHITALFCCNDEVALGAIDAARSMGIAVPDALSVIGFDDIDTALQLSPALTTVHVDKVTMGVLGVRLLRERIEKVSRPTITLLLGTHVVVRETVGPPRPI